MTVIYVKLLLILMPEVAQQLQASLSSYSLAIFAFMLSDTFLRNGSFLRFLFQITIFEH